MLRGRIWVLGGVLGAMLVGGAAPLTAQHPVDDIEYMVRNLRDEGQPVIPIFEGWYPREDGSYQLCFGYFNMNLEETVRIPLGENNHLEPAEYDGKQPTLFLPVPKPPHKYRRYFCSFSVNVPSDFGDERVWWTLVEDGKEYRVPGHITASSYQLEEPVQPSREVVAPIIDFIEPAGPEGQGRNGLMAETVTTDVDTPINLTIEVTHPEGTPQYWWVKWAQHQGPGIVTFTQDEIDLEEGESTASTNASFSEPGTYVLRVQAIDDPGESGSYQFQCCWTNGFVEVVVED